MSSFESKLVYKGLDVEDYTAYWWARFDGEVHWAMANGGTWEPVPWTHPEVEVGFDEPDFHEHFQKLSGGAAWEYSLYIEDEETLPEGVVFLHDQHIGTGQEWALFDPAKEVKPA